MKPALEEFKKYSQKHNVIPVYAELLADAETPVYSPKILRAKSKRKKPKRFPKA